LMRRLFTVSVLVAALVMATGTGAAIAGHRKAHRNNQAASKSKARNKNSTNVIVGTPGTPSTPGTPGISVPGIPQAPTVT
jgi:hypothetical protein